MDVTHVNIFPKKPYLHVAVYIYSHFMWAIPMTSERDNASFNSLPQCFSVMGIPKTIKTDTGPVYISKNF